MGSSQSELAKSTKDELVKKIRAQLKSADPAKVKAIGGVFLFNIITGTSLYSWTLDLNQTSVYEGAPENDPDATFTLKEQDFIQLATGRASPRVICQAGRCSITGDIMRAMQLEPYVVVLKSDSR